MTITIKSDDISKIVMFTDIHWGAKNNSVLHNNDCGDYINWFIELVNREKPSHIAFLGDWFENRNAVNIETLNMAYDSLKILNDLKIPIFFIIGNHDLYKRTSRDIHSVSVFNELENVILIDKPLSIDDKFLFIPYLFDHEYKEYAGLINTHEYIFGHFGFKDFVVTGYNHKMKHGPDCTGFNGPKYIFSGHFHKRQAKGNVVFIGNTFPTNFGDVGDDDRGASIFDVTTGDVEFENWDEMPRYLNTKLSKILEGNWKPKPKMRVTCVVDVELTYNETQLVKADILANNDIRDLKMEDNPDIKEALEGDDEDLDEMIVGDVDNMVVELLNTIDDTTSIKNDKLIDIYQGL